jgi:hypothetical protein
LVIALILVHLYSLRLNVNRTKRLALYDDSQDLTEKLPRALYDQFDPDSNEIKKVTYEPPHTSFETSQSTADLSESCDIPLSYLFRPS